jgi:succinate dehydrogenase/fumarate reductase flavoprotein subunit
MATGCSGSLHHRVLTAEAVTHHTPFRQETRWPGYYYRAEHPKLSDADWHVTTSFPRLRLAVRGACRFCNLHCDWPVNTSSAE